MSTRVLSSREMPERGGDGPRRLWSESPVPPLGAPRRVPHVGVPVLRPIHAWEFAGYDGETADFFIPDTGTLGPGTGTTQSLVINYYDAWSLDPDSITMETGDRTPTSSDSHLALPDVWTFYLDLEWLAVPNVQRAAVLVYDPDETTRGMAIQTHADYMRFHYQWSNFYGIPDPTTNYFLSTDMPTGRTRIRWVTDRVNETAVVEVDGVTVYDGSPSQFWAPGYVSDHGLYFDSRGTRGSGYPGTTVWSLRFYAGDVPLSSIAGAT